MTQNEQRFPQPSWILRLGRVWEPGTSCVSSRKEWAKRSSAQMGASVEAAVIDWTLTNCGWDGRTRGRIGDRPRIISGASALWLLPTTAATPGVVASSGGARCA